jgi:hypothetical protein
MRMSALRSLQISLVLAAFLVCGAAPRTAQQDIPSVDGGLGACRAGFTVHDGSGKPIYNAQIQVTIHYGLFNLHKTDLEVGTNSNGKAKFTGLPNFSKKPLDFQIKSGNVSRNFSDDPSTNCNAVFDVTLAVR